MSNPRVSVVMLSYNHEKFVGHAVQSVLNQTFSDFELIIVDDASTDSSLEILSSFTDSRIRLFKNKQNQGIAVSRSFGIDQALGEYISLLNSDDRFLPKKLEKQIAYLDAHSNTAATTSCVIPIDKYGQTISKHVFYELFTQKNRPRHEWLHRFFFQGNCLALSSATFRLKSYEKAGRYDCRLIQGSDFDLWIRLCLQHELWVMPEALAECRILHNHGNASSGTVSHAMRSQWEFSQILRHYYRIASVEEFINVFPEAGELLSKEEFDLLPYALAQLALKADAPSHRLFAIQTLHEFMGNLQLADKAKKRYGFSYKELIKLTGELDVFGMKMVLQKEADNMELLTLEKASALKEIEALNKTIALKDSELKALLSSKSWRITKPLRFIFHFIKSLFE